MISCPALQAIKNDLFMEEDFLLFVEIRYDDGDESTPEEDRLYERYYRPYNKPPADASEDLKIITFEGVEWRPLGIGEVKQEQKVSKEIPVFELAVSNVNRQFQAIIQHNIIENKPGRILYVHPSLLDDDTAKLEDSFTIVSASTNRRIATLVVSSLGMDLWGVDLPWELVSSENFPGVISTRSYTR